MKTHPKKNTMDFSAGIRSFLGYLEGTQKAALTLKNYKFDLLAFQKFIVNEYLGQPIRLDQITPLDVQRYQLALQASSFKTNTRRRRILTVVQFLHYLTQRKKLAPEMAKKIPTPHKIERIPVTVPLVALIQAIRALPESSFMEIRNKAMLWTLAETGCLVSEITKIRYEQWNFHPSSHHAELTFFGKASRTLLVSMDLYELIQKLKEHAQKLPWVFLGCNKFGSLGHPITARGVELLVKSYAHYLGFPSLIPRVFRHSFLFNELQQKVPLLEIQRKLGLKSQYAFKSYALLISVSAEKTALHAFPESKNTLKNQ